MSLRSKRTVVIAVVASLVLVVEGFAVQREIEDYRRYGDVHRELADKLAPIVGQIPRDRPVLLINRGGRRAIDEVARSVVGVDKSFFVRRDALWQMVFLPPLANFLGRPFEERLVRMSFDPLVGIEQGSTVLLFDDDGFSLRPDLRNAAAEAIETTRGLPPGFSLYTFSAE